MLICIDPGHGGRHPGAVHGDLVEKDIALNIALAMRECVEQKNHVSVVMTRETDEYVSIGERARIANRANADLFVSIHLNADPDPDEPCMHEASGEEILVYSELSTAYRLAQHMATTIDQVVPGAFRGVKFRPDLGVLAYTHMPAMLIECGFIDNTTGGQQLAEHPEVAGKIIARALLDAWGMQGNC